MPLIYRSMEVEGNLPKVGSEKNMLGVRISPNSHPDVIPDENGIIRSGAGGMSVAPNWRNLPLHLIPKRLNGIIKDARGPNRLRCWKMGEGAFESTQLTAGLRLRCETKTHGLVEPVVETSIGSSQGALAATQDYWQVDEG